jgi:hypothetical protein
MTIARRNLIGLLATGAATSLVGCGGGGSVEIYSEPPPVQEVPSSVWVLNVHPEFNVLEADFDGTNALSVPFQGLSRRVDLFPGRYNLKVRNRTANTATQFSYNAVTDLSSVEVIYRKNFNAYRDTTPQGLVSYFESSEPLITELDDGTTSSLVQRNVLAFESEVAQTYRSANCGLLVRRSSDNAVVYDSGVVSRPDAIVLFQASPSVGLIGALGLNYFDDNTATVTLWPNVM